jgi:hypothetical protein
METRTGSRLQHPLVVAVATNLLILLGILAVSAIPAWSVRPLPGHRAEWHPRDPWYSPTVWSPDGSMFVKEGPGTFQVAAADGTIVVRDQAGRAPVWLDDDTLLVLREVDQATGWLVRVDTRDGEREMVGTPIAAGRLVADGRGHVAHWTRYGEVATSVLDPANGTVVTRLEGFWAQTWTNDGALIVAQRPPNLGYSYPEAGTLSIWRPGQAIRSLATDLFQMHDPPVLAPSGDALACSCMSRDSRAGSPDPAIWRVPLDGAPPTLVTPWATTHAHAFPSVAWIDDETIAVLDYDGLFRVSMNGDRRPMLDSPPADLILSGRSGRVYHFDDAVIVVSRDPRREHMAAQLVVIGDDGRLRLRRRFDAWNLPYLRIDPTHHRAVLVTDPNYPGEKPQRLYIVELS